MRLDKNEIRKSKYTIITGLISTALLFMIYHFGNVLGLTNNSKESSSKILILFLFFSLCAVTLFIFFFKQKKVNPFEKQVNGFPIYAKAIALLVLILGIFGIYKYFDKQLNKIPPYVIKIVNLTDTTQIVSDIIDLSITKPVSPLTDQQVDYQRGYLSQEGKRKSIIIASNDSALANINFINTKRLSELYNSKQFDVSIILRTAEEKFYTIHSVPFSEQSFKNYYSLCKLQ